MSQIDVLTVQHCSDGARHVALSKLRTEIDAIVADLEGAK